jgi:hypothetical protein
MNKDQFAREACETLIALIDEGGAEVVSVSQDFEVTETGSDESGYVTARRGDGRKLVIEWREKS